ncbi:MAG: TetR/AcrR family transcriptional regulator [Clostridia bacterium]|nr:TetR/AcrR family transcriptional regulator [Clostridia bacterium]
MPKIEEQKNVARCDRKNQIVHAALKVFCEKGFDGATVNDIVKKAKCSHGLFYHYFNSKNEIFNAVTEYRGKNMMDFLDQVISTKDNYVEKLFKLTKYTFDNIKNDEIFAYRYYFFVSTVFAKAESGMLPPKCKTPPHIKMFSFFEDGIKSGDFRSDYQAKECAKLYNSIIQGATLNFILCPKEFKRDFEFPSIEFVIDIFKKEKQ